jgi:hypothetical protein
MSKPPPIPLSEQLLEELKSASKEELAAKYNVLPATISRRTSRIVPDRPLPSLDVVLDLSINHNMTKRAIADKFGVTDLRLSKYIAEHPLRREFEQSLRMFKSGSKLPSVAELYLLYTTEGMSLKEIAKRFGVQAAVVDSKLHYHPDYKRVKRPVKRVRRSFKPANPT